MVVVPIPFPTPSGRITLESDGATQVLRLAGEVDAETVAAYEKLLRQFGAAVIKVVDLSAVTFLDSSGVAFLIQQTSAHRGNEAFPERGLRGHRPCPGALSPKRVAPPSRNLGQPRRQADLLPMSCEQPTTGCEVSGCEEPGSCTYLDVTIRPWPLQFQVCNEHRLRLLAGEPAMLAPPRYDLAELFAERGPLIMG
jgi:ABC-type transporter Mla MlaB component